MIVNSTEHHNYPAMLKKAGKGLQLECKKKAPDGIQEGQVVVTEGYNLPCHKVLHVSCGKFTAGESEQVC